MAAEALWKAPFSAVDKAVDTLYETIWGQSGTPTDDSADIAKAGKTTHTFPLWTKVAVGAGICTTIVLLAWHLGPASEETKQTFQLGHEDQGGNATLRKTRPYLEPARVAKEHAEQETKKRVVYKEELARQEQYTARAQPTKSEEGEPIANLTAEQSAHDLEEAREEVAKADAEKADADAELARASEDERVVQAARLTLQKQEARVSKGQHAADKEMAQAIAEEHALKMKASKLDREEGTANKTLREAHRELELAKIAANHADKKVELAVRLQRTAEAQLAKAPEEEQVSNATAKLNSHVLEVARQEVEKADAEKTVADAELARAREEKHLVRAAQLALRKQGKHVHELQHAADIKLARAIAEERGVKLNASKLDHDEAIASETLHEAHREFALVNITEKRAETRNELATTMNSIAKAQLAKAQEEERVANATAKQSVHALQAASQEVEEANAEKTDADAEMADARAAEHIVRAAQLALQKKEARANTSQHEADAELARAREEEHAVRAALLALQKQKMHVNKSQHEADIEMGHAMAEGNALKTKAIKLDHEEEVANETLREAHREFATAEIAKERAEKEITVARTIQRNAQIKLAKAQEEEKIANATAEHNASTFNTARMQIGEAYAEKKYAAAELSSARELEQQIQAKQKALRNQGKRVSNMQEDAAKTMPHAKNEQNVLKGPVEKRSGDEGAQQRWFGAGCLIVVLFCLVGICILCTLWSRCSHPISEEKLMGTRLREPLLPEVKHAAIDSIVQFELSIQNLNYEPLLKNPGLLSKTKEVIKGAVAEHVGNDMAHDDVGVELGEGSVKATVTIATPPPGLNLYGLAAATNASTESIASTVAIGIMCVPGIESVTSGHLSVNVTSNVQVLSQESLLATRADQHSMLEYIQLCKDLQKEKQQLEQTLRNYGQRCETLDQGALVQRQEEKRQAGEAKLEEYMQLHRRCEELEQGQRQLSEYVHDLEEQKEQLEQSARERGQRCEELEEGQRALAENAREHYKRCVDLEESMLQLTQLQEQRQARCETQDAKLQEYIQSVEILQHEKERLEELVRQWQQKHAEGQAESDAARYIATIKGLQKHIQDLTHEIKELRDEPVTVPGTPPNEAVHRESSPTISKPDTTIAHSPFTVTTSVVKSVARSASMTLPVAPYSARPAAAPVFTTTSPSLVVHSVPVPTISVPAPITPSTSVPTTSATYSPPAAQYNLRSVR